MRFAYAVSILGMITSCATAHETYQGELLHLRQILTDVCRDFSVNNEGFYCQQVSCPKMEMFETEKGKRAWCPDQEERSTRQYWDNLGNTYCDGRMLSIGDDSCPEDECTIITANVEQCNDLEKKITEIKMKMGGRKWH